MTYLPAFLASPQLATVLLPVIGLGWTGIAMTQPSSAAARFVLPFFVVASAITPESLAYTVLQISVVVAVCWYAIQARLVGIPYIGSFAVVAVALWAALRFI